jgi:hypothetical protein
MHVMKSKFITRAYIVGEFSLYIVVLLTLLALIVVHMSTISFDMGWYLCDT